jgi:hypothetical protein
MVIWFMVFNATFNNISVISWQSDLLVEETEVPGENHEKSLKDFPYFNRPFTHSQFDSKIKIIL